MAREAKHKNGKTKKAGEKQLTFDEPKELEKADKPAEVPEAEEKTAEQETSIEVHEEVEAASEEVVPVKVEETTKEVAEEVQSVKADTHAASRKNKPKVSLQFTQKRWHKLLGLGVGILALITLVISGISSQYFKNKTMPNVAIAGVNSAAKRADEVKHQVEAQKQQLSVTFVSGEKKFTPKLEEIGLQIDVDQTVQNALNAKRDSGLFAKLAFWKKVNVPAVITVNDNLLSQYIETNLPELLKAPQDSQLQFDTKQNSFVITPQADGEGANTKLLKTQLLGLGEKIESKSLSVELAKKGPTITEAQLQPLLQPANQLTQRKVVLTGLGYSFRARPADIAAWITPTPQPDGALKLVVDAAKVQSYIDSISKRISNAPVDRKIIRDEQSGREVVLQEGRAGTELADRQTLATAITEALKGGQDTTQTMNITTAAFQTVNMEAYEKWIEVDISEQRTTAYERATPIKNFLIASGTKGHETVLGEFAIWHKNRKQTMQGGSKADGSYYSIPNVEWVSYFYKDYALHGAWWREKFGAPASHGCVNMTNADAQWIYEWAPIGTKVIVHQ